MSFKTSDEIEKFKKEIEQGSNPRDIKFILAEEIVDRFHEGLGFQAKENFINRFQKGKISQELEEIYIEIDRDDELITRILKDSKLLKSTSDAMRMIKQGAIKVNEQKVLDDKFKIKKGTSNLVQVGKKKAARIIVD